MERVNGSKWLRRVSISKTFSYPCLVVSSYDPIMTSFYRGENGDSDLSHLFRVIQPRIHDLVLSYGIWETHQNWFGFGWDFRINMSPLPQGIKQITIPMHGLGATRALTIVHLDKPCPPAVGRQTMDCTMVGRVLDVS